MILYVNGDGHASAAEASNQYSIAGQDPECLALGRLPHPDNLSISWGKMLSLALRIGLLCEAGPDRNIDSIITSTKKYLDYKGGDVFVIIQWPNTTTEEDKIWQFHNELSSQNVKHIFFNSTNAPSQNYDWSQNYIQESYIDKLRSAKIDTVSPVSDYFSKDGHAFWNRFLLNHIIKHKFI